MDRLVDDNLVPCVSGPVPIHATIGDAVAAASPGETILVCGGTYAEHVTVEKQGLTLRAQGVVNLIGSGGPGSGFLVTGPDVVIQGFDISGFDGCGVGAVGGEFGEGDRPDIRDNDVHDNAAGICVRGSENPRIRYNVIEGNLTDGIVLSDAFDEEVSANTTRDNGGAGIRLNDCHGPTVDHNLVIGNGRGIWVVECNALVRNNTLRNNVSFGIGVFAAFGGAVVTRNLVQSSGVGVLLDGLLDCEASFNSISFNDVGLDLRNSNLCRITRNNVSRSTIVDCRWDGLGMNVLTGNNCSTQDPPGAFK